MEKLYKIFPCLSHGDAREHLIHMQTKWETKQFYCCEILNDNSFNNQTLDESCFVYKLHAENTRTHIDTYTFGWDLLVELDRVTILCTRSQIHVVSDAVLWLLSPPVYFRTRFFLLRFCFCFCFGIYVNSSIKRDSKCKCKCK